MKTPVVWTLHDCWPMTGHCAYFEFVGCEKYKTACFSCPQTNNYPCSNFIDRSSKNYNLKKILFNSVNNVTIVPVSNWLGDIVTNSFLSKYPKKVIQNGIDITTFSPELKITIKQKYKLKDKFVIIGVANIWEERKRLTNFIKLSKHLDSNYQILLVGLSKKQIIILPKPIIGIKKTESVSELAELYSSADIFLNPTWADNFSNY